MHISAKAYRIETGRLVIRCYRAADAALVKKSIDESLTHLKPWMPWTKGEPESVEAKAQRLSRFKELFEANQEYNFGIFDKNETELIGSTGFHMQTDPAARGIGYWINVNHLNKGYATEATMALVKVGFELEGLKRIEIHCDARNTNSYRIPERIGFKLNTVITNQPWDNEEKKRNGMVWVLFKEDYERLPVRQTVVKAYDGDNRLIL